MVFNILIIVSYGISNLLGLFNSIFFGRNLLNLIKRFGSSPHNTGMVLTYFRDQCFTVMGHILIGTR